MEQEPPLQKVGAPEGAVEGAGGGPGQEAHPHHPGQEEGVGILHWKAAEVQLALWLQPCQGVSRGWASSPSQLRVSSLGQEAPRGGHAGPHKPPASLPPPQPHRGAGVPG